MLLVVRFAQDEDLLCVCPTKETLDAPMEHFGVESIGRVGLFGPSASGGVE